MSILQINQNENVSSILHSLLKAKPADIEWPHYTQLVEQQENSEENTLSKKRARARKFLRSGEGKKFYRKDKSCVFTPQFVKELGNLNAVRRSRCNPWLRSIASDLTGNGPTLSASVNENVLPFGPHIITQNRTADFPS